MGPLIAAIEADANFINRMLIKRNIVFSQQNSVRQQEISEPEGLARRGDGLELRKNQRFSAGKCDDAIAGRIGFQLLQPADEVIRPVSQREIRT